MPSNQKFQFVVLCILWLFLQIAFFLQFGIVTGFEAQKYIEQAGHLIQYGSYSSNNFLFYSIEIGLIALCLKLNTGFWPVVSIQLLANAVSVYCFYKLCIFFTNAAKTAFAFTFGFLLMVYYQLYNVHLFTESLFFSFSIIYTWYLFRFQKPKLTSIVIILLALIILTLTRPTGMFFIPATLIFISVRFFRKIAVPILAGLLLLGIATIYFLINFALGSGGEYDFLLPYVYEHIICGVPTVMEAHTIKVPGSKNSIAGLGYIIQHYWPLFLKLSIKRLLAFFGLVRSYYSLMHNFFIGIYFYTLYLFIIGGIKKMMQRFTPEVLFLMTLILFTALTVALSCDEWHNRFIFSIMPFILLLATSFFLEKTSTFSKPHTAGI